MSTWNHKQLSGKTNSLAVTVPLSPSFPSFPPSPQKQEYEEVEAELSGVIKTRYYLAGELPKRLSSAFCLQTATLSFKF